MPAYKEKESNKWYCKFYYTDYKGQRKQKLKRGFSSKREAQSYERDFLVKYQKDITIPFKTLVSHYKEDIKTRLKESSVYNKSKIIDKRILPFFENMSVNKITTGDVRRWQNELIEQGFSNSYLKSTHTLLVTIFNYAVKYYGLSVNPASKAGSIGSQKPGQEMKILTLEQFNCLIDNVSDIHYYTALNVLFYTGMRIGEMLALTWSDIDFDKHIINIDKTMTRLNGKTIITPPKTTKSVRSVRLFPFLEQILIEYKKALYEPKNDVRAFSFGDYSLRYHLNKHTKELDLPKIRIHDLRHSHASLLINNGVNVLAISERLGHESVETTLKVYSHLYPNTQDEMIEKLENLSHRKNK